MMLVGTALACPAPSPEPKSEGTTDPIIWYHEARTMDLTADGHADSVHLEATGTRADSLQVSLTLFVNGEEKHREEWSSSYEVMLRDTTGGGRASLDAFVRARLDAVLASAIVEPLSAPSVRLMAEDSAILAGLAPRPTHRVSFSYGYETAVRLVWDAPRERFVRLFSCC